jgi:hypothetical protein
MLKSFFDKMKKLSIIKQIKGENTIKFVFSHIEDLNSSLFLQSKNKRITN